MTNRSFANHEAVHLQPITTRCAHELDATEPARKRPRGEAQSVRHMYPGPRQAMQNGVGGVRLELASSNEVLMYGRTDAEMGSEAMAKLEGMAQGYEQSALPAAEALASIQRIEAWTDSTSRGTTETERSKAEGEGRESSHSSQGSISTSRNANVDSSPLTELDDDS